MKQKNKDLAVWGFILIGVIILIAIAFPTTPEVYEALHPVEVQEETQSQEAEPVTVTEQAPLYDVPLSADLQEHIYQLCDDYNVDMPLVLAIIGQESNYNAGALGDGGNSIGLMQIQPQHHQQRMDKLGTTDLTDPYQNVTVGVDLLAELIDKNNGTEWAVTAYNAGTAAADYHKTIGIRSDYAESVMMLREMIETNDF